VTPATTFAGRTVALFGLGGSGIATALALQAGGAEVVAFDDNPKSLAKASAEGVGTGDLRNADWSRFAALVLAPGVPLTHPEPHWTVPLAKAAGIEIIGDIELFARARPELPPHKVVGITGTNGKSTTTALVHHILKTAGVPATMGGNIGLPILAQDPLREGGVYVLELSSYQIDLTKSLDCDVAVLLNITPDHLDRYDGFEDYAASKARLFEMQSPKRIAVVDYRAEADEDVLENAEDPLIQFIDDVSIGNQSQWPALEGPHNRQNAAAASVVCRDLGLTEEVIERGLRSYPGLPHRMERIREVDGVLFVNDSKATNAEAAAPALAAYPRIRWIVGGQAKAETLGDTAKHLDRVVRAYTIGEAGPMFTRLLRKAGVAVDECETLENAVNRAARDSLPGETVLLSPASASFDQFRDFEARGDRFRELVEGL
jgi:UDP-N-acetylmuramoylalanine--D-glutamate ligase